MLSPSSPYLAAAAALLLTTGAVSYDAAAQGRGGGGVGSSISRGVGGALSTSPAFGTPLAAPTTRVPSSPATALPPSAIGTPAPQVAPVAPLAPPTTETFLGGGGTTVTTPGGVTTTVTTPSGLTTPAPGVGVTSTFVGGGSSIPPTSASPSESAPSAPGGGVPGFAACMGFWDAGTHMNKREWAAACRRTENRLQSLKSALDSAAGKTEPSTTPRKRGPRTPTSRAKISRAGSR